MNVLIVEDEPSLREEIRRSLEPQTTGCDTAGTYAEAEDRLLGREYDIVVLDRDFPAWFSASRSTYTTP